MNTIMNDSIEAWKRARQLIDTLDQRSPKEACVLVSALRDDLGLAGQEAPLMPDVAVLVELAAAVYCEIDGRHGDAIRSYNQLLHWYELLGPISEAHVDGLVSALGWSVLNEQHGAHLRFDRVVDEAIERLDVPSGNKVALYEWVRIWRERGENVAGSDPVLDFERFEDAREEFEVDEVTLDELETHSLKQVWSTLGADSDWQETYRKLSVVLGEMGFMRAVAVANAALTSEHPDPGAFSASLSNAFSTARRHLAA